MALSLPPVSFRQTMPMASPESHSDAYERLTALNERMDKISGGLQNLSLDLSTKHEEVRVRPVRQNRHERIKF